MLFDTATMTFQAEDTDPPSYWPLTDEYYGQLLDGRGQGNTIGLDPDTGGPALVPIPPPAWQEVQAPIENAWRAAEMPIARENVTAIEFGDDSIPGTAADWKAYWLALRAWVEGAKGYPDATLRPLKPS